MEQGQSKILVYRSARVWLLLAVSVVLLVMAGYLVFDKGKLAAGGDLAELRQIRKEQARRIEKQQRQIAALTEQAAVLERSSEIDRRASQEVRNEFAALQTELMGLRKELDFYRGIVAPGDAPSGLRVQKFEIKSMPRPGGYALALTLTQVKHNERYVTGIVELEVEGLEDGASKVLVFKQLGAGENETLSYKFRYFQNLQAEIWIPPEFQPLRATIFLKPKGKGQPPAVEETHDWPA